MGAPGRVLQCPGALLLSVLVPFSCSVRLLSQDPLRCPRQDLNCTASHSYCFDRDWSQVNEYTPSEPEDLRVWLEIRQDERGKLQPVLGAQWTIKDEGSIRYLRATELHLLVLSTNQNICIRYSFMKKLSMRSPSMEKWTFSADVLVLDPGQQYRVSVFNIPKPELSHTSYDVSAELSVPQCDDLLMEKTQVCIETGSLWRPNVSVSVMSADRGRSALTVSFRPDSQCDKYLLIISCSSVTHTQELSRVGAQSVNASFSLDQWPRGCCEYIVQIKPWFPRCGNDCMHVKTTQDVCSETPRDPPYLLVVLGVTLLCAVTAVGVCLLCRSSGPAAGRSSQPQHKARLLQVKRRPKLLLVYSQDHRLYTDVVLRFCAFLQDRCGAEVLVDLLDSLSVSEVGGARWLVMQQQRLQPEDKVLLLCSKGVQAKWRALCVGGHMTPREDQLCPSGDILTAFFNLFLPSMHQAGALGKYLVAYFEELGDERDVPSLFDISVKYVLMKNLEEMLFRILDVPKYEPGHVSHVHGLDVHGYFTCPSGRALRAAIQAFQDYQHQHPDWFQECESSQENLQITPHTLSENLQLAPVLQCVPEIREGPPAVRSEVNVHSESCSILRLSPHINTQRPLLSVAELQPVTHTTPGLLESRSPLLHEPCVLTEQEEELSPYPVVSSPSEDFLCDSQLMEDSFLLQGTCANSDSDLGYFSKLSSQQTEPPRDPLQALVLLQEQLFEQSLQDGKQ